MITFKCKMCGGDLHPEENATTCECEYCGSVQTIPTADNEKKGNLFNRANRLRMVAEYDKAAAVYTSITAEFPEEAEAYWGLCLCKYGIEYVEDPVTAKKIPTCHRTRSESIMDDPDFDQACENADAVAKRVYREEAKAIDRLQQDILSVVANESPYDVFICYKETDDDGQRTEDSVLAQDIYDALTAKGLKVFFARITLEDKLGQQYEPYIYAALHSAKVMLAIGTQFEYFDAVWVKNEWSRFLDMMKSDKSKTLIPCYKDIDAYDMPREFKNLQAQDMGKLGWLQDLTRGVMKLCGKEERFYSPTQQIILQTGSTVETLLQRAFLFLEDGKWQEADDYAERVLDIEPTNARAYLSKLMASLQVRKAESLCDLSPSQSFENNEYYKKIVRYGDDTLKEEIEKSLYQIECTRQRMMLNQIHEQLTSATSIEECERLKEQIKDITYVDGVEETINIYKSKKEEIANHERMATTARSRIETLKEQLAERQRAEECLKRTKKRIGDAEQSLVVIQQEVAAQEKQLSDKQEELSNLGGLFNRTRRKELELQINVEQENLNRLRLREEDSSNLLNSAETEMKEAENRLSTLPNSEIILYEMAGLYDKIGMITEAYKAYIRIKDYADVTDILSAKRYKAEKITLASESFTIGRIVRFGNYLQRGREKSPIEWIVLKKNNETAMLVSKYALDVIPFQIGSGNNSWEDSSIRQWLNNSFLQDAFTAEEQNALLVTCIDNSSYQGNPRWHCNNFASTKDKVFLLSHREAKQCFKNNGARVCFCTPYAKNKRPGLANGGSCFWWLRTQGEDPGEVENVCGGGQLGEPDKERRRIMDHVFRHSIGTKPANDSSICVRPAVWVDINLIGSLSVIGDDSL